MHFRLVVLDRGTLYVMDPLYNPTAYPDQVKHTLASWANTHGVDIENIDTPLQHDTFSCGYWVLYLTDVWTQYIHDRGQHWPTYLRMRLENERPSRVYEVPRDSSSEEAEIIKQCNREFIRTYIEDMRTTGRLPLPLRAPPCPRTTQTGPIKRIPRHRNQKGASTPYLRTGTRPPSIRPPGTPARIPPIGTITPPKTFDSNLDTDRTSTRPNTAAFSRHVRSAEGQPSLTLASWNMQNYKSASAAIARDSSSIHEVPRGTGADILVTQETHMYTNNHKYRWPHMQAYSKFYSSYPRTVSRTGRPVHSEMSRHGGNQAGRAIFVHTKWRPDLTVTTMEVPTHMAGHLMLIRFNPPARQPIYIFNTYMPPPKDKATEALRREITRTVTQCIRDIQTESKACPLIMVGGDYNATWYQEDGNPHTHKARHTEEYREWVRNAGVHPVDQRGSDNTHCTRERSFESKRRDLLPTPHYLANVRGIQHTYLTSRIDDWLTNVSDEQQHEQYAQAPSTTVHQCLMHDSDHHPVTCIVRMKDSTDLPLPTLQPTNTTWRPRLEYPLTLETKSAIADSIDATMDRTALEALKTLVHEIGDSTGVDVDAAMGTAAECINGLLTQATTTALQLAGRPDGRDKAVPGRHNRHVQHGHMTTPLGRAAKTCKRFLRDTRDMHRVREIASPPQPSDR
mmetsp:Transcript_43865/g.82035  ORF Transcript_43865/g.82035 Transcript_43865/m.82035 type:complete len:680 (-) Transcript_43865:49-2088(-)